ncbi:hypothetical protein [Paracoccus marinus]|uniref:hypothetical protein n=1 Tax=Paracoccus marinus TaxID=288426 RepID=UPI0010F2CA72|nr:hypothetical protein [Paracoccus marinus]
MMSDLARPHETPIRREERALGAWLKTIKASRDFDTGGRLDKEDGYACQTIWYHGVGERGRAGESPFSLPGASRESWMSSHVPFIYRRADISAPPRKNVFTDDGELGADGTRSGRPLRFLDHGSELHDALVSGYAAAGLTALGKAKPVVQTSVRLPEGHPARGLGPLVVITVVQFDPFPDELLPALWTAEARAILNSAPTEVQKTALSADRRMLHTLFRSFQRRIRIAAPAVFMRKGYWKTKDGWQELSEEEADFCLQPITSSTNNALASGRIPLSALEKHEAVNALRSRQLATITSEVERYRDSAQQRIRHEVEGMTDQMSAHFLAEIRNRELML